MKKIFYVVSLFLLAAACGRRYPGTDLSTVDNSFMQRCADVSGVLVELDERYDDYWGGGYDTTSYLIISSEGAKSITAAPTRRMTVRRQLLRILNEKGVQAASTFSVRHYRERQPPVEVHLWTAEGREKPATVQAIKTEPLVDWPCENGFPRQTTFRIAPLLPGDLAEIITPVSGPDQLRWQFASPSFCQLRSRVSFGHPDDNFRPDMDANLFDASAAVQLLSPEGKYPLIFELAKPLLPLSNDRAPFVLLSPRCPGWSHLRGRILRTALWLARAGEITGRNLVNPFLASPVKEGERGRRIATVAEWLQEHIQLEDAPATFWFRWMPTEAAHKTAQRKAGPPGNWAILAFRILEQAGLKPQLALLHTHPRNAFRMANPTAAQMDTLAVTVTDDQGRWHWLVPGVKYDPETQPPLELRGKKALVLERWWLDRETGAGRCEAELEITFSCQMATPEPVELKLVELAGPETSSSEPQLR